MSVEKFSLKKRNLLIITIKRTIFELLLFISLAFVMFFYFSDVISDWVKFLILFIAALYIIFNLCDYKKTKKISENFCLTIEDSALACFDGNKTYRLPYSELSIVKVTRKKTNIDKIKIKIKSDHGPAITLKNIENMDDLYNSLLERIEEE